MIDLQKKVTDTAGPVIDLGADEYAIHDTVSTKRTITGNGARISVDPSSERDHPAIVLRGDHPRLLGLVQLVGPAEHGAPYIPELEAQHAIRIDGATHPEIGQWHIRNFHGDGIYPTTVDNAAHAAWTTDLWVHGTHFDEIGRHAITPAAADHTRVELIDVQRVNLSIVDIEPDGDSWGCTYFSWTDSVIHDTGGGFTLANKGAGTSDSVHDILLDRIHCLRRPFSVTVNPPPGVRRRHFTVRNCAGVGEARVPQLIFRHVDGVTVENVRQPMRRGVKLVETHDCTDVTLGPA